MDAFWPGKVTVVLEARSILPMVLTGGSGRIGIRVPGHPVCREIVRALSGPLTATSANLSGQPGCRRIEDLPPDIIAAADFVLDAGPLQAGYRLDGGRYPTLHGAYFTGGCGSGLGYSKRRRVTAGCGSNRRRQPTRR